MTLTAVIKRQILFNFNFFPFRYTIVRGLKWYPDAEFFSQFDGPVMYHNEITSKWKIPPYNGKKPVREMKIRNMVINFGPAHPAAHGCLRMITQLDGEVVKRLDPHIGLLHRGTEKLIEYKTYTQALPYFDRLDYMSCISNEHSFVLAVEKLLNVQVPRRAQYIRVLFAELTRLLNHLGATVFLILDVGGITPLFGSSKSERSSTRFAKEYVVRGCMPPISELEGLTRYLGSDRQGDISIADLPLGLMDDIYEIVKKIPERIDEVEDLCTKNRIFLQRTRGIGVVSAHDALSLGFSELDFDVPVGDHGDAFDRWYVRVAEIRQSCRIVEQCLNNMPAGEVKVDDHKITPPTRVDMKTSMESIIHHFKLFSQGFQVPPGVTYTVTEHPKGEFGVYLVSDGSSMPYRCKIRAPSFLYLASMDHLSRNLLLADAVSILASLDVVFGDIDR
ncbi:hypothetical protein NQ318_006581 [Aromia moschata]|uniref:Complex I-49kD n=1 Tax=Aromia moschata TaxID=1265417 RepID=A0AAV8YPU1_9CUCU|nr:hypothetical protein NQ318_006581 [Aromia moschata]